MQCVFFYYKMQWLNNVNIQSQIINLVLQHPYINRQKEKVINTKNKNRPAFCVGATGSYTYRCIIIIAFGASI